MFNYARSDTHFLLFVYDNMRNELIDNSDASHVDGDLIKMVMSHSRNEALQCYERPFYDMRLGKGTMGWYNLLCRTSGILNREQFAVFRAVHFWRDTVARQEDESIHVIMSKQVLFNIARVTPMDLPSLLGCSHPMSKFFQKRKDELLRIIKQAKKDGATGPEMNDVMETVQPAHAQRELNVVAGGRKAPATGSATHESVLSKLPIRALSLARSGSSVFWGPIVFTEMPSNKRPESWNEGLRLALPLPQLTAELYEDPNSTSGGEIGNNQINLRNLVERQDMKEKDAQQDFFAVQQGGTSRKRKTLELQDPLEPIIRRASSPNQGDDKEAFSPVGSDDPQNEHDERKRLKRAKKMEKRKARSLEKSTLTGTDGGTEGFRRDQPFDYANASSVLHAKRKGNEAQARGNKTENPYLKSMDAPKGLRKTKIENGGNKSFTFKG